MARRFVRLTCAVHAYVQSKQRMLRMFFPGLGDLVDGTFSRFPCYHERVAAQENAL